MLDGLHGEADDGLLSHDLAIVVPSTLQGLTTVFGMGTGVAPARWSPAILWHLHNRREGCWAWEGTENHKNMGRDQTSRAISTARLKRLCALHLRPINLVVSQGPSGILRSRSVHLGNSFPLRCFQRLSARDIATGRCSWRNSPYTSGRFVPVLSY